MLTHGGGHSSDTNDDLDEASSCKHKMMVVPISTLLQFDGIPSFEELCFAGLLVEWKKGMQTAFISHTWLGADHPDPDGEKIALLRSVLLQVQAGQLEAHPHWTLALSNLTGLRHKLHKLRGGFVWLDFCCVPQRATQVSRRSKAIASIPSYIARCTHFLVLAGAWKHRTDGSPRDLHAWLGRGWCRMEMLSNALAPKPRALITIESSSAVTMWGSGGVLTRGWVTCGVATGAFTDERDRTSLGPVILSLIARRERQALKEGDLTFYRRLRAVTGKVLDSTGLQPTLPASLDDFLAEYRFKHALDSGQTSPLHCAVLAGRADIATVLLDKGADVESAVRDNDVRFEGLIKGMTVLHVACIIRDRPDLVKLLLARGADPSRTTDGMRLSSLHFAAMGGNVGNIDALLAHDPPLGRVGCRFGGRPFVYAVMYGGASAIQHLSREYPELVEVSWDGKSTASLALTTVGDVATLRETLSTAGGDVDFVGPATSPGLRRVFRATDLMVKLGTLRLVPRQRRALLEYMAYSSRCAAIHRAAYTGHLLAIDLLLKSGADANSDRHPYNMQPLHIAALRGHHGVVARLLRAGASPTARCSRGRTPAAWAARSGHHAVVELLDRAAAGDGVGRGGGDGSAAASGAEELRREASGGLSGADRAVGSWAVVRLAVLVAIGDGGATRHAACA